MHIPPLRPANNRPSRPHFAQKIDEHACIEVGEEHLVHPMVKRVICTALNAIMTCMSPNGELPVYKRSTGWWRSR